MVTASLAKLPDPMIGTQKSMAKTLHFTDTLDIRPDSIYCGRDSSTIINARNMGGYLYQWLDYDDYKQINSLAHEAAQSWYIDLKLPWLFWDDFSLGQCLENHFYLLLRGIFENILAAKKILDRPHPSVAILSVRDSLQSCIIAATLETYGVPIKNELALTVSSNKPPLTFRRFKEFFGLFLLPKTLGAFNDTLVAQGKENRLFFSFAANHFRAIWPLLRTQQYHNVGIQSVIGNDFRRFSNEQYNFYLIDSQTDFHIWSIYRTLQRETRRYFADNNTKSILRDKFIFQGVNYFDAAEGLFSKLFTCDLPNTVRYYEICKKVFAKAIPSIVIFGDDASLRPRAAIAACKKLNIPSMLVQHGIIAAKEFYYPTSDYMSVWGEHSRDVLIENGTAAAKLRITGSCAFSIPKEPTSENRSQRKILIITNPQPIGFNRNPIPDVIKLVSEVSNVLENHQMEIVVKVHPVEDPQAYRTNLEKAGVVATVQSRCDLDSLIRDSLVVITTYSTVAIQAVLNCTPVICLPSVFPDDTRLRDEEMFYHATGEKEAAILVSKMLSGDLINRISKTSRASFLSRYCIQTGPDAVNLCEALIEEIIATRKERINAD